jgi:hypothetical protein
MSGPACCCTGHWVRCPGIFASRQIGRRGFRILPGSWQASTLCIKYFVLVRLPREASRSINNGTRPIREYVTVTNRRSRYACLYARVRTCEASRSSCDPGQARKSRRRRHSGLIQTLGPHLRR